MKIAVEGCAHGELEKIYNTIENIEKEENIKIDLLLCCGDFQATRNLADLQTMAVPKKYQDIGTFYKYYSGELVAPVLTIFIGGNHEASNYMQELPYGGWVAPNIFYLGYAGVVRVAGLRIAGISGIYKGHDFLRGRHEFPPYTESSIRSVYHTRQLDVFRLKQLSGDIDIFLSHDWPRGIYNYGNKNQLLRFKPHFRNEVENNQLGSRPLEELMDTLQPKMWFAAHLHCQFVALVPHYVDDLPPPEKDGTEKNSSISERYTKFLALDKCLPKRRFLQIIEIDSTIDSDASEKDSTANTQLKIEYDLEWLTVLLNTNHLISVKNSTYYMPGPRGIDPDERYKFTPTKEELDVVRRKFNNDLRVPENFSCTVPPFDPKQDNISIYTGQPKAQIHYHTTQFCSTLGIDDPVSLAILVSGEELNHSSTFNSSTASLNDSCTSVTSELSLSAMRFDVSTSSEGSPAQRKGNVSLNLPKPINVEGGGDGNGDGDGDGSPPLIYHVKPKNNVNPDELQLSDSESKTHEENVSCEIRTNQVPQDGISTSTDVSIELLNETRENEMIDTAKSPAKKFKRRNQEIYTEKEEEDQLNA